MEKYFLRAIHAQSSCVLKTMTMNDIISELLYTRIASIIAKLWLFLPRISKVQSIQIVPTIQLNFIIIIHKTVIFIYISLIVLTSSIKVKHVLHYHSLLKTPNLKPKKQVRMLYTSL